MFFNLSALNLGDRLGLVTSPQFPYVSELNHPAGVPQVTAAQIHHCHNQWDRQVSHHE